MYIVIFFLTSSNIDFQGKILVPYELNLNLTWRRVTARDHASTRPELLQSCEMSNGMTASPFLHSLNAAQLKGRHLPSHIFGCG